MKWKHNIKVCKFINEALVISSKDEKEIGWKGQRLLNKEKRV